MTTMHTHGKCSVDMRGDHDDREKSSKVWSFLDKKVVIYQFANFERYFKTSEII